MKPADPSESEAEKLARVNKIILEFNKIITELKLNTLTAIQKDQKEKREIEIAHQLINAELTKKDKQILSPLPTSEEELNVENIQFHTGTSGDLADSENIYYKYLPESLKPNLAAEKGASASGKLPPEGFKKFVGDFLKPRKEAGVHLQSTAKKTFFFRATKPEEHRYDIVSDKSASSETIGTVVYNDTTEDIEITIPKPSGHADEMRVLFESLIKNGMKTIELDAGNMADLRVAIQAAAGITDLKGVKFIVSKETSEMIANAGEDGFDKLLHEAQIQTKKTLSIKALKPIKDTKVDEFAKFENLYEGHDEILIPRDNNCAMNAVLVGVVNYNKQHSSKTISLAVEGKEIEKQSDLRKRLANYRRRQCQLPTHPSDARISKFNTMLQEKQNVVNTYNQDRNKCLKNYSEYVDELEKDLTWAAEAEFLDIANMLKINIEIFKPGKTEAEKNVIEIPGEKTEAMKNWPTIKIKHDADHYNLLVESGSWQSLGADHPIVQDREKALAVLKGSSQKIKLMRK